MILTDKNGKEYRGTATSQDGILWVKEVKPKTFSWDDVANDVMVSFAGGSKHFMMTEVSKMFGGCPGLRFSEKWNVWSGGECPLPGCAMVKVRFRDGTESINVQCDTLDWYQGSGGTRDVIAFKVVRLAEGHVYPDEVEL